MFKTLLMEYYGFKNHIKTISCIMATFLLCFLLSQVSIPYIYDLFIMGSVVLFLVGIGMTTSEASKTKHHE